MAELPALELHRIGEVGQVRRALPNWGLASTQLEPGVQASFHHQLIFDDFQVMHFLENRAIAFEYRLPPDTTGLCLFTPKSPLQRWCGIEIPCEALLINPNGRDCLAYYPAGFISIGIVASNALLDELEISPHKQLRDRAISTNCVIPCTEEGKTFSRWLYRVLESVVDLQFISRDPLAAALFQERVFEGLASLLGPATRLPNRAVVTSTFCRYGLVRRALDLIDRKLTERLSTRDIATELGVSPRVLQFAFRDTLQTSPYEFVLKRKLKAVRLELLDPSIAENNVTHSAVKYGFTELGRFSQRYQRMYGELPSRTKTRPRCMQSAQIVLPSRR